MRESDAVDGPVALQGPAEDVSDRVHVASHEVSAYPIAEGEWPLQIDRRADSQAPEGGPGKRLRREVAGKVFTRPRGDRETHPLHGDAVTQAGGDGDRRGDNFDLGVGPRRVSRRTVPMASMIPVNTVDRRLSGSSAD